MQLNPNAMEFRSMREQREGYAVFVRAPPAPPSTPEFIAGAGSPTEQGLSVVTSKSILASFNLLIESLVSGCLYFEMVISF